MAVEKSTRSLSGTYALATAGAGSVREHGKSRFIASGLCETFWRRRPIGVDRGARHERCRWWLFSCELAGDSLFALRNLKCALLDMKACVHLFCRYKNVLDSVRCSIFPRFCPRPWFRSSYLDRHFEVTR